MLSVLTCIFVQHDLRLVVVAALICATACSAAFGFHLRSLKSAGSTMSWAWLALTGLVAGSGVWATHFVAMLAYQPSLSIGYAIPGTVLSFLTAVLGMGLGFALPVARRGVTAALSGGVLTGSSVAAMHFMGIAAIRTQARFDWDMRYVVASVVIGALGAAAAFYLRTRLKGRAEWLVPAVVLVVPQFILIRQLGWMNTYAALIVPGLFSAFGTFLLRQSLLTIPKDFEEAADAAESFARKRNDLVQHGGALEQGGPFGVGDPA